MEKIDRDPAPPSTASSRPPTPAIPSAFRSPRGFGSIAASSSRSSAAASWSGFFVRRRVAARAQRREYPTDFNAYLSSREDGRVTVLLRQESRWDRGVITSLAQMAAEELGRRAESIDMVMGRHASSVPGTGHVRFVDVTPSSAPRCGTPRHEAREVLVELASERLRVPKEKLSVAERHRLRRRRQEQERELRPAGERPAIERHLTGKPALRAFADFTVERPSRFRRLDGRAKVTGEGPLRRRHPPAPHAPRADPCVPGPRRDAERVDTSAAESIPGVRW